MINFGIIGTNSITRQFIEAAEKSGEWRLTAVYSRTTAKAEKFAADYHSDIETSASLEDFFASQKYTTVYIASPNSLHFPQVKMAIEAGKNVIVEKPAASNPTEMKQLVDLLEQHPQVHFFEAARHIHEPNFKLVAESIKKLRPIQGANLTYEKYSSKMDNFLAGRVSNVFTLDFSGGALQDLGIYLVYDAVCWFGRPQKAVYLAKKLSTGVDGKGTAILDYGDFNVVLNIGKIDNSYLPGEIYGFKKTIELKQNAADLQQVSLIDEKGKRHVLANTSDTNPMSAEVMDFAAVINHPDDEHFQALEKEWFQRSQDVNQVLYDLRQSAGIVFPADKKEEM